MIWRRRVSRIGGAKAVANSIKSPSNSQIGKKEQSHDGTSKTSLPLKVPTPQLTFSIHLPNLMSSAMSFSKSSESLRAM